MVVIFFETIQIAQFSIFFQKLTRPISQERGSHYFDSNKSQWRIQDFPRTPTPKFWTKPSWEHFCRGCERNPGAPLHPPMLRVSAGSPGSATGSATCVSGDLLFWVMTYFLTDFVRGTAGYRNQKWEINQVVVVYVISEPLLSYHYLYRSEFSPGKGGFTILIRGGRLSVGEGKWWRLVSPTHNFANMK